MAKNKTVPNSLSATEFLAAVADSGQRADCAALNELMVSVTGHPPVMWGATMVGYGQYAYTYASGRSGEWFETGFSPRKGKLSVYLTSGVVRHAELLRRLGKHQTAKSCLYIRALADVDLEVLRQLIERSVAYTRAGDVVL